MAWRERTANQTRSARARPKLCNRFLGRLFDGRFVGEAEVIVRGKIEQRLGVNLDVGRLRRINSPQFTTQALLANSRQSFIQLVIEFAHFIVSNGYDLSKS